MRMRTLTAFNGYNMPCKLSFLNGGSRTGGSTGSAINAGISIDGIR